MRTFFGRAILASLLLLNGCAGVSHGIRIYPQNVYLFVDATKNSTRLLTLPDIKNGYDVKPWSFLSKHEFKINLNEAQVTELESKQDSTTALALLQKIVEIAGELGGEALKAAIEGAKAGKAAKAVADVDLPSAFGLPSGIYKINNLGRFENISPIDEKPGPSKKNKRLTLQVLRTILFWRIEQTQSG